MTGTPGTGSHDHGGVRLGIVTVLYNSAAMLEQTLPSWTSSAEGLEIELCLVDNSAAADCREVVTRKWKNPGRLAYLTRPDNPGFAASMNEAVGTLDVSHVLLLNPDVWLEPDTLRTVLAAITEFPHAPVALSTLVHGEQFCGVGLTRSGVFYDLPYAGPEGPEPIGPSGGAAVVPRRLWDELRGLDEAMFAWGEDADLAIRLLARGHRCRTLATNLRHEQGHSHAGSVTATRFKTYLLNRNRVRVAARSLTGPAAAVAMASWLLLALMLAPSKLRQGLAGSMFRGLRDGVTGWRDASWNSPGDRLGLAAMLRRPGARWTPS